VCAISSGSTSIRECHNRCNRHCRKPFATSPVNARPEWRPSRPETSDLNPSRAALDFPTRSMSISQNHGKTIWTSERRPVFLQAVPQGAERKARCMYTRHHNQNLYSPHADYKITFPRLHKVSDRIISLQGVLLLMHTRKEFRKHIDVGKKDFGTIEYLLRRGRNQLETYSDPGIRDIHV
jgi:hypothetical protein